MKQLTLTRGFVAFVDDEDYERVARFKWHARTDGNTTYALSTVRSGDQKKPQTLLLHRVILNAPKGVDVDHVDSNGLNNVRANLRLATRAQNCRNQRTRKNNLSAGYRGVHLHPCGKFIARITVDYKRIHIGQYETPEAAALAYNEKAKELHGTFARLNTIPERA